MKTVSVKIPQKEYNVIIENGILETAGAIISKTVHSEKAAVICDANVMRLYAGKVITSLELAGFKAFCFSFPGGEAAKNSETLFTLLEKLSENNFSRNDTVVTLGGGVTGDVAGLVAAMYMRGINLVHIPTSLLAMVDSAVGGKVAVNLKNAKNSAGTFYQPKLVLCDPLVLQTLPRDELCNGLAEVVKYGIIKQPEILKGLQKQGFAANEDLIHNCVQIKARLTAEDEFDFGARKLLNFGHTIGHAIEVCSNYTLPHGKAVALGIAAVTRACVKDGLCDTGCFEDVKNALTACGLPIKSGYDKNAVLNAVVNDKKRESGNISLVLVKGMGDCYIQDMPLSDAAAFLRRGLEG